MTMYDSAGYAAHLWGKLDHKEPPACCACDSDFGARQQDWLTDKWWHEDCREAWYALGEWWCDNIGTNTLQSGNKDV